MNILILGSGGREHTLAWKIAQSPLCTNVCIAPGNGGTREVGKNIPVDLSDFNQIKQIVIDHGIHMVVVGPEAPLVEGIYDFLSNDAECKHVKVIGPSAEASKLEGSKSYAKEFMAEFNIPTAAYRSFTKNEIQEGIGFIESMSGPYVLKADGLAAGKGVIILTEEREAKASLEEMLNGQFGKASETVVVEEFLEGIEFSVFVITDGNEYVVLPQAKDYKRIGEGDTGLNTGGMGSVSPVSFVDYPLMEKVERQIIKPTLTGIKKRKLDYTGFIFFGLINVKGEPKVIEYNCRMGDPETEVVLPRIKSDFVEILQKAATKKIANIKLEIDPRYASCIMLVSGGYPEEYEKGKRIVGYDTINDSYVFHAGTKMEGHELHTNGGRVIAICSLGSDMKKSLETSYKNANKVDFEGKYFRSDIGFDL